MKTSKLISIQQFCTHYKVSETFINQLQEYELVEVIVTENEQYLQLKQLHKVEKMMRLHYDLQINLEGLDVISNLLSQLESHQNEIILLKNRLQFYED